MHQAGGHASDGDPRRTRLHFANWLREPDLNQRPQGYEPDSVVSGLRDFPWRQRPYSAQLSGGLLTSCILAPLFTDVRLRAAAPSIAKLQKLILQRMTSGFDSRHVVDELPNLAS